MEDEPEFCPGPPRTYETYTPGFGAPNYHDKKCDQCGHPHQYKDKSRWWFYDEIAKLHIENQKNQAKIAELVGRIEELEKGRRSQ